MVVMNMIAFVVFLFILGIVGFWSGYNYETKLKYIHSKSEHYEMNVKSVLKEMIFYYIVTCSFVYVMHYFFFYYFFLEVQR